MKLTQDEAYRSMIQFLDMLLEEKETETLAAFWGGLQLNFLWDDGRSNDPAALEEWQEMSEGKEYFTLNEAFQQMQRYVRDFYVRVQLEGEFPLREDRVTPQMLAIWEDAAHTIKRGEGIREAQRLS